MKVALNLANSADPDEMQHHAAFHLGYSVCQSTLLGVFSIQSVMRSIGL